MRLTQFNLKNAVNIKQAPEMDQNKSPSMVDKASLAVGGGLRGAGEVPADPNKDNTKMGMISNTIKGLPGAAVKVAGNIFNSVVKKPLKSLITAPETILSGGAKTEPGTYQGDTAQDIKQGMNPALAGLKEGSQAVLDTATLGEGASAIKDAAPELAKTIAEKYSTFTEKKAAQDALDIVTPKLSKKETEAALSAGRGKGGGFLSKTTITPNKRLLDVADSVKGIVQKGASGADNINKIRSALSDEAENLKSEIKSVDKPYDVTDLEGKLDGLEKDNIELKSDTTMQNKFNLTKDAALKIAKKSGNTVSSLLDARKEFDALVDKQFPTLYDRENAPFRSAVTSIRNAMNDFIEENLPDDVSFKNSLRTQSMYYDAIDNIAGKSASETKTTGLRRAYQALEEHPVVSGLGIVGADKAIKKVTGIGL